MDKRFADAVESDEVPIGTPSIEELNITLKDACRVVVEITIGGIIDKDEAIGFKLAEVEETATIEEPCIEEELVITAGWPLDIEAESNAGSPEFCIVLGLCTVFKVTTDFEVEAALEVDPIPDLCAAFVLDAPLELASATNSIDESV